MVNWKNKALDLVFILTLLVMGYVFILSVKPEWLNFSLLTQSSQEKSEYKHYQKIQAQLEQEQQVRGLYNSGRQAMQAADYTEAQVLLEQLLAIRESENKKDIRYNDHSRKKLCCIKASTE